MFQNFIRIIYLNNHEVGDLDWASIPIPIKIFFNLTLKIKI